MHPGESGDFGGAATVLGHLQLEPPAWSKGPEFRTNLMALVADVADLDERTADGAAMDRRRAVAYALERLDMNA